MSDLATRPDPPPHADTDVAQVEPAPAPTLISEQQVLLGSAAALAGPKVRRNYLAILRAALGTGTRTDRPDEPVKPRHYPRHHQFIEDALMSRMMDRL